MKITVREVKEARYLKLDVAVRYGDEDMPFDAPLRNGDTWIAMIDLHEKRIVDWPQGKTLSFKDMKICDEGYYSILDEYEKIITIKDGYVPNQLLPGGHSDYLSLDIDENGIITNWKNNANLSDFDENE